MSKSNDFEDDLLKLIFNGTPIPNLADNAVASPLTALYITLHTADPGEAGKQTSNEVSYTGYSRVSVVRTTAGWTVLNGSVSPNNAIEFGEMTSGTPGNATYASVGTHPTGGGKILYRGQLSPAVAFNVGVQPKIRTTTTITED